MRFVKAPKSSGGSVITSKGKYTNKHGRVTNHSRDSETSVNFVSVDGEGMMVDGVHKYVLFGIGDEQIEDSAGLQWYDIFDFAYARYRPKTAFTGFYLGYDFTQIIKTMPEDRAYMLLTSEGRATRKHRIAGKAPHPVEYDGWQFDMLTMKRLRLRPKGCDCPYPTCKCKHDPWMYICDVGGFFQCSFLKAINPAGWPEGTQIVTDEEYEDIREGKERRSTAVLDDEMRRYNLLENDVLARVMRTLDTGFHGIGIHLPASKWFGPGQAAQAWLKNEEVSTRKDLEPIIPLWFNEAARMSYFGGWFEQMMHGIIPGESHEYDVNSAYPSVIASLPCLLHGTYTRGEGIPTAKPGDLCLVYAKVWSPTLPNSATGQHIGSMLHRDPDGSIHRPMGTEGWFWWDELQAAQASKLIKRLDNAGRQQVMRWVKYEPCDCPPPMAGVQGLYQKRLDVGKTSPLGKAAKLVYNSKYGKFAQSVGEPIFGNPIYASRITSGCRTMILNAIASHPKGKANVAMVATDAVYFLDPHPTLPLSEKLGEWDHIVRHNLTLFKPGVYWDDKAREAISRGDHPQFKARGFKADDFAAQIGRVDAQYRLWDTELPKANGFGVFADTAWPKVDFTPSFTMVTALQALRRNNWESAGAVATDPMALVQNSNPYMKRNGLLRETYDGRIIYRSEPHYGMWMNPDIGSLDWTPSTPYTKRFGMEDPWSDEYKEQMGNTPDGSIVDILAWILTGE